MTGKSKTIEIDGSVVRIDPTNVSVSYELKSTYAIIVDGIHRGYVGYGFGRNQTNRGWRTYVRGLDIPGDGASEHRACHRRIGHVADTREKAAAAFPSFVARGQAPSEDEAHVMLSEANAALLVRIERRKSDRLSQVVAQEARERARREEIEEILAGLDGLRRRLGTIMTNVENVAVEKAAERIRDLLTR